MRALRIYALNNFQVPCMVVFPVIIMVYVASLVLPHLELEVCTFDHLPLIPLPLFPLLVTNNHCWLISFSRSLMCFFVLFLDSTLK